jgi:hypothetical protein
MKFIMKKIAFFAAVAALAFAFSASAATLADFGTTNIKVGSRGPAVMAVQSALNTCTGSTLAVDGVFGPMTANSFRAFQMSQNIKVDGIVGPQTKAMLAACSTPATTPVDNGGNTDNSDNSDDSEDSSDDNSGPLEGGAGDIDSLDLLSSFNNEKVKEGAEDVKIFGFELEASDDSDLDISSVKLAFANDGTGSTRLTRYVTDVKVWMGSEEVGSADSDEFSRSGSTSTKSIALEDAIVRAGEKVKFYVSVSAVDSIDSSDITGSDWSLDLTQTRFEDAEGVVSTDTTALAPVDFEFEDGASSSTVEAKFSMGSGNPSARTVEVDDVSDTDDVLLLEMKLNAKGSEMMVDELPFSVTSSGATIPEAVKTFRLLVDGEEIDSVSIGSTAATCTEASVPFSWCTGLGTGTVGAMTTATVLFSDLEDDFVVDADDTVTIKLVADINDTEGSFGSSDSVTATFASTQRDAAVVNNPAGDEIADSRKSGAVTGEAQTFYADGATVTLKGTPTISQVTTTAGKATQTTYTMKFDVTAFGETFYMGQTAQYAAAITGTNGLNFNLEDSSAPSTAVTTGTVSSTLSSAAPITGSAYRFDEGSTREVTLQVVVTVPPTEDRSFRVQANSFKFFTDSALTAGAAEVVLSPSYSFETGYQLIDAA